MRTFIKWTEKMSCGIPEIDEQHQSLIHLINELHESFLDKTNQTTVADTLAQLIQYTSTHFMVEESLMRLFNYRYYQIHKEQHDLFREKILEFQREISKSSKAMSEELIDFLRDWLIQHILTEDKNFTPVILNQHSKHSWIEKFLYFN